MPKISGFIQHEISKGIIKATNAIYNEIFDWEKPKPPTDYWGDVLDELKGNKKKSKGKWR